MATDGMMRRRRQGQQTQPELPDGDDPGDQDPDGGGGTQIREPEQLQLIGQEMVVSNSHADEFFGSDGFSGPGGGTYSPTWMASRCYLDVLGVAK